jgi:hypothetical protein
MQETVSSTSFDQLFNMSSPFTCYSIDELVLEGSGLHHSPVVDCGWYVVAIEACLAQ